MPRRHLWLMFNEHRWQASLGLLVWNPQGQQREECDLPTDVHVCPEGSRRRHVTLLRAVQADLALLTEEDRKGGHECRIYPVN